MTRPSNKHSHVEQPRLRQAPSGRTGASETEAAVEAAATRQRLLDAAGTVFASVGYERAHVRDICARARANVAAIKYHFGGKYPLYEAAIHWCFDREKRLERSASHLSPQSGDPDVALRQFVRSFIGLLLDPEKPSWHAKLLAREMVEPTGALDAMVANVVKPTLARLRAIILGHVGPNCPKLILERTMLSVIAQCVFYVHGRPVLERVFPRHVNAPDLEALADHIATFSLAGVNAVCRSATGPRERGSK